MISKVSSKNKEKHCKKKNSVKKTTIRQKKKKTIQRNRKQRHRESNPVYLHALRASNSSTQTRTQSLLCMRCDLWEGFSEFVVHQGKEGRKTRSDWQITEIFLHKSIISCKHQYFTFFLSFLVFFTVIDYLHGHPSSLDFPRLVI